MVQWRLEILVKNSKLYNTCSTYTTKTRFQRCTTDLQQPIRFAIMFINAETSYRAVILRYRIWYIQLVRHTSLGHDFSFLWAKSSRVHFSTCIYNEITSICTASNKIISNVPILGMWGRWEISSEMIQLAYQPSIFLEALT